MKQNTRVLTCKVCGDSFTGYRASYCSDACKMRNHRAKKKQKQRAKRETIRMEVYMEIDKIIEHIHYEKREVFYYRLTAEMQKCNGDVALQLDRLNLVRTAMEWSGCI